MRKIWKTALILCLLGMSAEAVQAEETNTLTLPAGLETIEEEAFYGVVSAEKAVIPEGTVTIGPRAFAEGGFSEIRIPSTVTDIGEGAFRNCGNADQTPRWYCIPAGVNVDAEAFEGCGAALYIDGREIPYLNYTVLDEGVTITGILGYSAISEVVIPDVIDGKPVTAIANGAFNGRNTMTGVTIPDTVVSIGNDAFRGCSSLTEVDLPVSLTTIGSSAFRSCGALTRADLPAGVTSIGNNAFRDCGVLAEMVIPSGVTEIAQDTFSGDRNLLRVVLPEGLTSIGETAFYDCYALAEMNIPSTVTEISKKAFCYNRALTQVTVPAGITDLANEVFFGCSSLESVTLPDGLLSIGEYTFGSCTKLTDINFPAGLTTLGKSAFENACKNQSGYPVYRLPESLETVGVNAFYSCGAALCVVRNGNLESLILENGNTLTYYDRLDYRYQYKKVNDVYTLYLTGYAGAGGNVSIPAGPAVIGSSAFENNETVTGVTIPSGVTLIDTNAFRYCTSLASVTMPDTVTTVLERAFAYCGNLTDVTFSANLTVIKGDAFYAACTAEGTHIYELPDGLTECSSYVFQRGFNGVLCVTHGSLSETTIRNANYIYTHYGETDFRYRWYNNEGTEGHQERLVGYLGSASSVEIPSCIWMIDDDVFRNHSELTKVVIPEGVTRIFNNAFRNCANLTDISLPDSLTYLEESVFNGCGSSAENGFVLELPSGIDSVGSYVFDNSPVILVCELDSVTADRISNRGYSFVRADRPEEPEFRYRQGEFNHIWGWGLYDYVGSAASVRLPDDCSNVWSNQLRNKVSSGLELVCGQLSETAEGLSRAEISFTFPGHEGLRYRIIDNVLYIMAYAGTGSQIIIPQAEDYIQAGWDEQIRQAAFSGKETITKVTVPEGVTRINDDAFNGCINLTDITLPESLKSMGTKVFRYCGQNLNKPFILTLPDHVEDVYGGSGGGANVFEDLNAVLMCGKTSQTAAVLSDSGFVYTVSGEEDYRYLYKSYTENGETGRRLWLVGYEGESATANIPAGIYGIDWFKKFADPWPVADAYGFRDNLTVTKVVIPEGTEVIKDDVFNGCINLTDITLPESLKSMGTKVFRYCGQNLNTPFILTLPDHIEDIYGGSGGGANVFEDLNAVLKCGKTSQTAAVLSDHGFVYTVSGEEDYLYRYVSYTEGEETGRRLWLVGYRGESATANIPAGIYGIDWYKKLTDPWPVAEAYGFRDNLTVTKVVIPEGTEVIEDSAFKGCLNLTDITFPSTLKVLKNHAFEQCGKNADYLHYYRLPDNMTEISTNTAAGWGAFTDINMGRVACSPDTSTALQLSGIDTYYHNGVYRFALKGHETDGLLYLYKSYNTDDGTVNRLVLEQYEGTNDVVNIPAGCGLYRIENNVFKDRNDLQKVIIPSGVVELGENAFNGCAILHGGAVEDVIQLPDTIVRAGNLAFRDLGNAWTSERFYLVLPSSLSEFDINIFSGCNAILVAPAGSAVANALYSNWYYYYNTLEDARTQTNCQFQRYYVNGVEQEHAHYGRR